MVSVKDEFKQKTQASSSIQVIEWIMVLLLEKEIEKSSRMGREELNFEHVESKEPTGH